MSDEQPTKQPAEPESCSVSLGDPSPGMSGDYDPAAVEVRNAATVLILDERPDIHVLMLQRNARSVFVGSMWVYPGGAVDPDDASKLADDTVSGLTDDDASAQLSLASGGIAYWVAALRETFEEAGLLLAHTQGAARRADGSATDRIISLAEPDVAERFGRYRDEVNRGERDFISTVAGEQLHLDGDDVHFVGRWITPLGPPRRYDTRFFATAMPTGQVPLHDNDEAVEHRWVRPAEAVELNAAGEMSMMTPTLGMLKRLAQFSSVEEAIASAATSAHADDEPVRIRFNTEGPDRIAFPADADYAESSGDIEAGVLRWPAPPGTPHALRR